MTERAEYGWCPRCRVWSPLRKRVSELGLLCYGCDEKIVKAVMAYADGEERKR